MSAGGRGRSAAGVAGGDAVAGPGAILPRRVLLPALAAAAVLAAYAPLLARGMTSEDFLLVRVLGERPPWDDLRALFGEPWLGITVVRFLRPVATLLYGIEIAAFGPWAPGYDLVHVLVHAGGTVLLWAAARRLLASGGADEPTRDRIAAAAALAFGLHPFHPNAVVFAASFATLFAGALLLAALVGYLRYRAGSRAGRAVALVCFALALGSYEAAVVLPAWLAAHDHLLLGGRGGRRHRALVAGWLPFALLAGLYLLWRRAVLGVLLAGYDATGARLLEPRPGELLRDLALALQRLHLPLFDPPLGTTAAAAAVAALLLAPLGLALARRPAPWLRPWALGWVVTLTSLAPFAFEPMVPANGRYGYLAAIGVALSLGSLAAGVAAALPRRRASLAPLALAAAAVAIWGPLLAGGVRHHREAAATAAAVRDAVARFAATSPGGPSPSASPSASPGGTLFVTRYPYFLTGAGGTPLAQVFHYGLRDACRPPFHDPPLDVRPLPPLAGAELLPVLRRGTGRVLEWDGERRAVREVAAPVDSELVELAPVDLPPRRRAARAGHPDDLAVAVRVPRGDHARFRLLLSAPINGVELPLGNRPGPAGVLRARVPGELVQAVRRLYGGGTIYWWIEARDAAGRLSGASTMRELQVAAVADR